jgi:hypothetical protein
LPDWLIALLVGGGGGLVGYLLRGWIDDRYARAKEARAVKQSDVRALRDDLLTFLGHPKAHFSWLENVPNVLTAGGTPTPAEKAQLIAGWVYANSTRYPKDRRGPMYLILNVAYQLARGDRHFLDANPKGYEALHEAWNTLDEYAQELTVRLHNPDQA